MQRVNVDPHGGQWIVQVQWLDRRVGRDTTLARYARWRADRRGCKAVDAALVRSGSSRRERGTRWYELLDPARLDRRESTPLLFVVLGIVVLIWLGPGLLGLLRSVGELFALTVAAMTVSAWRTLAGRPWAVVATDGELRYSWSVNGYRRARSLMQSAAKSLTDGLGVAGVDAVAVLDVGTSPRIGSTADARR
jgi:hypothetical protein